MENDIELQPQDIAMQDFLQRFHFPLTRVRITDDGMQMIYPLLGSKYIETYLRMARLTILIGKLPLKAKRDRFEMGDLVFQDNIVISFIGTKSELPCY